MKKWKSGMSFLSFAICGVFLSLLVLMIIGVFIRQFTVRQCDIYIEQLARQLVVCDNLEEAKKKADAFAFEFQMTGIKNMEISVDYAVGYNDEVWKKGGYIAVSVHADLNSLLWLREDTYDRWLLRMIEKSEVYQIE